DERSSSMSAAAAATGTAAEPSRAGWIAAAPAPALVGASAVDHALAVRELVPQTALQPAAHPGQLRWVQTQVLLFGHLDRDGLEGLQPGRTAEWAAARAVAAEHPRLVADADLPHLDADPEVRREVADELAKVHASFGGVIEDHPRAVEELLHTGELHRQPALADLHQADPMRLSFALLVLQPEQNVLSRRPP